MVGRQQSGEEGKEDEERQGENTEWRGGRGEWKRRRGLACDYGTHQLAVFVLVHF